MPKNVIIKNPTGGDIEFPDGGDKISGIIPVGTIWQYGGSSAPAGWLICDGSEISQSTYADLYAIIGTSFGDPGGGNFNLPNFADKFPKGVGTQSLGATGGTCCVSDHLHCVTSNVSSNSFTIQSCNLPTHTHGYGNLSGCFAKSSFSHYHTADGTLCASNDSHNHTNGGTVWASVLGIGSGYLVDPSNTSAGAGQVGIADGNRSLSGTTNSDTHSHNVTGNTSTCNFSGNQTVSMSSGSTSDGGFVNASITPNLNNTTENSTSEGGHDNQPPFAVVNFIIKY